MIFGSQLPNDLLRNAPWSETIISWELNDSFLEVIEASEKKLHEAGYYLKYGLEINLSLLSPSEAVTFEKRHQRHILANWRHSCRTNFSRDTSAVAQSNRVGTTLAEVHDALKDIAKRHSRHPLPESEAWLTKWELTKSFYADALDPMPTPKSALGQKNFMIAALHLLPQHVGGLEGLIEQRFASKHYGIGWWDGRNALEIRTIPTQGFTSSIENYHHVLWRLKSAVEKFNFVPVVNNAAAQVHFSLWRTSDHTNIMAGDDDDSRGIQKQLIEAVYQNFRVLPYGKFSRIYDRNPVHTGAFAGSARPNTLRLCKNNWELRLLGNDAGVTHIARDIFYISSMIANQLHLDAPDSLDEIDKPETGASMEDFDAGDDILNILGLDRPKRKAILIRKLDLKSDPNRVACPFISCIESAWLSEENRLEVPIAAAQWNFSRLRKTISNYEVDLFSAQSARGNRVYNLNDSEGWRLLFRQIRVLDDLTLDISEVPHELRDHFSDLSVTSIRKDFHIPENESSLSELPRSFRDQVLSRYLEQGTISAFDNWDNSLSSARSKIFGFIHKQGSSLSPEEALPYLISLLNQSDRNSHDDVTSSYTHVLDAVSDFLICNLLDPLNDIRRYKRLHLDILAPFVEEEDVFESLNSCRQQLIAVLPLGAQYNPPESITFFRRLGTILCDPTKLYSFSHMRSALLHTAHKNFHIPSLLLERRDLDDIYDARVEQIRSILDKLDENPVEYLKSVGFIEHRPENIDPVAQENYEAPLIDQRCYNEAFPLGQQVVNVAAVAQVGEEQSRAILAQYAQQVVSLTDRGMKETLAQKAQNPIIMGFLHGVSDGIIERSQLLLTDNRFLKELRQRYTKRIVPLL